jgi:hypothetical protein
MSMNEKTNQPNKGIYKNIPHWYLYIVLAILILVYIIFPHRPRRAPNRIICMNNLKVLGIAIQIYADEYNGMYPTPEKWCDLLASSLKMETDKFICKGSNAEKGQSSYCLNKNIAGKKSSEIPPDTVLLFDTKKGWNQVGGPEKLTFDNHDGKGCCVLFNAGDVEFIKTDQIGQLNWGTEGEKSAGASIEYLENFRRPKNDEELRYWLENMVWYHHFNYEEIRAATGLTDEEIKAGLEKFDIRPDNRPPPKDDKLFVLPYPGGRHPRIGFLEGAVDPQRETKFSVFTPWDKNSYVVVDLPEAIWSNLGLTYLAHTHIDTIWTAQGIELKKLEWNRYPDGRLEIERELPNGIAFGAKVKPTKEAVLMEMCLKNGTDKELTDLRIQICLMPKMVAGFEQQTNDNKVLTNPYVACRDSDGKRWIITAMEGCHNPWANPQCPCFHSDPKFPDLEPGQAQRLRGWLSFYEGTDIEAEFKRIEETGWRD